MLAWKSVSCNHVSLPRLDDLPLGEDLGPREARERGEGSGEVEGACCEINIQIIMETVDVRRRTLLAFPASNKEGRLGLRGTCQTTEIRQVR